jgi:hypothetical protein
VTRVFLGGSRRVSRLNEVIRAKLQEIVRRNMEVVIGDANGADKALQRQLADWHYSHVTVYFVGQAPRNNEGGWATRRIEVAGRARGFAFYSVKDKAMAAEAECGFMLWDGQSRGTLANVEALVTEQKPVALYLAPAKRFANVKTAEELERVGRAVGLRSASVEPEAKQEELGFEGRDSHAPVSNGRESR